jgi:ribosome biogenesis protein MAK21
MKPKNVHQTETEVGDLKRDVQSTIRKLGLHGGEKGAPRKKQQSKEMDKEMSLTTYPQTCRSRKAISVKHVSIHKNAHNIRGSATELIVNTVGIKWYDYPLEALEASNEMTAAEVEKKMEHAKLLLEQDSRVFAELKVKKSRSEQEWIETVLRSGTLSDKVAALTVLIQESFVHHMTSFEQLVAMAKKKGRREAIMAVDTLKELLLIDLLPDRKLKSFKERPLLSPRLTDAHLILWYVEDRLKSCYLEFLKILELGSHDILYFYKAKIVDILWNLLVEKPEQERSLLSLLVNKLGDTEKKLCSKVAFLLSQLLEKHPSMNVIVVREIDQFMHRSNLSDRARYYAMTFLNQILLTSDDQVLANHLIMLYFNCFQKLMMKREMESKFLAAILTGVNRAFPFGNIDQEV